MHRLAKRSIILRPHAPWYKDSIDAEKKERRNLERRLRKSCLSIDSELYFTQCVGVDDMIISAKSNYYSSIISENKGNQKVLFKTIDQLHYRKPESRYPTSPSNEQLRMILLLSFTIRYLRCGVLCQENLNL